MLRTKPISDDLREELQLTQWDSGDRYRNPLQIEEEGMVIIAHPSGITVLKKIQGADESERLELSLTLPRIFDGHRFLLGVSADPQRFLEVYEHDFSNEGIV